MNGCTANGEPRSNLRGSVSHESTLGQSPYPGHSSASRGSAQLLLSLTAQDAGCMFFSCILTRISGETHITYGLDYEGASAGGEIEINLGVAAAGALLVSLCIVLLYPPSSLTLLPSHAVAECGGVEAVFRALALFGNATHMDEEGFVPCSLNHRAAVKPSDLSPTASMWLSTDVQPSTT